MSHHLLFEVYNYDYLKVSYYSALGAAAVGGKMLVAGGYDGISSLNSVEMYDLKSNT